MNTLNQLLRAIITYPDADDPRLQFADALDELPTVSVACRCHTSTSAVVRGAGGSWSCSICEGTGTIPDTSNRDRAVFIRVQVERDRLQTDPNKASNEHECVQCYYRRVGQQTTNGPCHCSAEYRDLCRRVSDMLRQGYFRWSPLGDEFHKRVHQTVHYTRGFLSSLTCSAADFLAHADALIWHEAQTVKCETCDGCGWECAGPNGLPKCTKCQNSMQNAVPYGSDDSRRCASCKTVWQPRLCPDCVCGRAPRPCPDTAQPVTKVMLTTEPNWSAPDAHIVWKGMTHPDRSGETFTCDRWPGVEFELPPTEPHLRELRRRPHAHPMVPGGGPTRK